MRQALRPASPWQTNSAELARIAFARAPAGNSYIATSEVRYPFHLGRALRLPDDPPDMVSVYLQSCSGGIFSGENLLIDLKAGAGSRAHVSTGAATIAYNMDEGEACQTVSLDAERGAFLEYWPQSTILFPQARLHSRIEATVRPGATLVACDSFSFHTPSGSEDLFNWYRADLSIHDGDGRLLAGDRLYVEGPTMQRSFMGKMGGNLSHVSIVIVGDRLKGNEVTAALRTALEKVPNAYSGVSDLPSGCGLILRVLASDNVALKQAIYGVWAAIRQYFTGIGPKPRRL